MVNPNTTSTQPYLLRALYEWCGDNGLTPHIAVLVDDAVQVPHEYVRNGQIVLNIGFDATNSLKIGNEYIEFKARFGGIPRDIFIPINRVLAIYARETDQGMAFSETGQEVGAEVDISGVEPPAVVPLGKHSGPRPLSPAVISPAAQDSGQTDDDNGPDEPPTKPGGKSSLRIVK